MIIARYLSSLFYFELFKHSNAELSWKEEILNVCLFCCKALGMVNYMSYRLMKSKLQHGYNWFYLSASMDITFWLHYLQTQSMLNRLGWDIKGLLWMLDKNVISDVVAITLGLLEYANTTLRWIGRPLIS